MAKPDALDFLVNKTDWKQYRFEDTVLPALADGQVRFGVDRFAFTANNISYALAGDMLGYWRFFPAPDGWGRSSGRQQWPCAERVRRPDPE